MPAQAVPIQRWDPDYTAVLDGIERLEVMLRHRDHTPIAETDLRQRIEGCKLSLEQQRKPIHKILEDVELALRQAPFLYHLELRKIVVISNAIRTLSYYSQPDGNGQRAPYQYEEFGDVFRPLTEALRCEHCFPDAAYNQIDPDTWNQYSWPYIGALLKEHAISELPRWYHPPTDEEAAIVDSLKAVCDRVNISFETVAWQIVNYHSYQETLWGPQQALRTGNWEVLLERIKGALAELRLLMKPGGGRSWEVKLAAESLLEGVQAALLKWFIPQDLLKCFDLSDAAKEHSQRVLDNPDGHFSPLMEFICQRRPPGWFPETPKEELLLDLMGRFEPDVKPPFFLPADRCCSPARIDMEPILGHVLAADQIISHKRIHAILETYHYMTRIADSQHPLAPAAIEDISLTLLMSILNPSLYRSSFLEDLPRFARLSPAELAQHHLVRLPHRGLASTADFDGFFPISMGRYEVPVHAAEIVAEIVASLNNGDEEVLRFHGLDTNAEGFMPLYSEESMSSLVPLLRGILNFHLLSRSSERLQDPLRLVDLTLSLYTLVRRNNFELLLDSVIFTPKAIYNGAGKDEHSLNVVGLTRRLGLGIVALNREDEGFPTTSSS
ncbi:hypothetical protein LOZ62_000868 [Ophidiomyces ophidiicola]|nr:hypothetical protein LOZ62_000868 [Ophidiomyces ophidiicola]